MSQIARFRATAPGREPLIVTAPSHGLGELGVALRQVCKAWNIPWKGGAIPEGFRIVAIDPDDGNTEAKVIALRQTWREKETDGHRHFGAEPRTAKVFEVLDDGRVRLRKISGCGVKQTTTIQQATLLEKWELVS